MVQKKLPLINSAHGSETRNIINELIKLFNNMGYTYNESLQKAQDILEEAQQTNDMNESVQQQINTLIAESGTSDAEVLQARFDAEGNEYPLLKDRLDESDAQLAQIDPENIVIVSSKNGVDQSDEINDAINTISNSSVGRGVVYLNGEEYRVEKSIRPKSGVTIKGSGRGSTVIKGYGDNFSIVYALGSKENPIIDFELSDLTIDGSGLIRDSYIETLKGVYMTYLIRATFRNLYIVDTPATALGVDFLQDSNIENVVIERGGWQVPAGGVGGNGIGIGTGLLDWRETLTISNCHAIDCGNSGIMLESQDWIEGFQYSGFAQIINCTSRGNRYGFRDSGNMSIKFIGNSAFENIDGFMFSAGMTDDIDLIASKEIIMSDNHSYKNTRHGLYLRKTSEVGGFNIHDNHLFENEEDGIHLDRQAYLNHSKINGNHIYKNKGHGFYVRGDSNHLMVSNNIVYENNLSGLRFYRHGSYITVSDNKSYNNGVGMSGLNRVGIQFLVDYGLSYEHITVAGNHCYDSRADDDKTQTRGILFSEQNGSYADVLIMNNTLSGNSIEQLNYIQSKPDNYTITNNKGYNDQINFSNTPIVSADSPYIHNSGSVPEYVYIVRGSITDVTVKGVQLESDIRTVYLPPNSELIVTFNETLHLKRQRH